MTESLSKLAAKYALVRLGCMAGASGVAALILIAINGTSQDTWFQALLIGLVVSLPLTYFLGRDLRERLSIAMTASREASRARVEDTNARVRAVEEARKSQDS